MKKIVAVLFIVLCIAAASTPAFAGRTTIDFEDAPVGVLASSLSYPGVSFDGGFTWGVLNFGPMGTGNELIGLCGDALTISFATDQSAVNFLWASASLTLQVGVFLDGNPISTEIFAGPYGSSATINGQFDMLVVDEGLGGGCAAIDNISFDDGSIDTFADGRINRNDKGSPVVLYPVVYENGERGLDVYAANGTGLLFRVSPEEIAAAGACPESNTIIVQNDALNIIVARLPARSDGVCPFQLNAPTAEAGKYYVIIFDALVSGTPYESYEEFFGG